jgi:hypothetical protein
MTCSNNLKQMGVALHNHASANNDKLPPMLDYARYQPIGWQPFWFSLYPYIEQDNIYKRATGTDGWGANNHNQIVKPLQCPADSSSDAGLATVGAGGWFVTSYAPNYYMFGLANPFDSSKGVYITQSRYNIGNIPDGTSNTVGIVERLGQFTYYGWSNAALYPMSHSYWGWNSAGSVYGVWGIYLPQVGVRTTGNGSINTTAHPYYPSTSHTATLQVLLMDGSVRGVTQSTSQANWNAAVNPEDGAVLPGNW